MKRDMDLARKILLAIEAYPEPWDVPTSLTMGYSPVEISYHIKLLAQAGLIEAMDISTLGEYEWRANCLTWQGHEFLDASRDESRWIKAKGIILKKGGSLSFEILKQVLMEIMKGSILS